MTAFMRVKPIGTGTPTDPLRCPIPTYQIAADLGGNNGWIVQVRDEDVPVNATTTQLNVPGFGNVTVVTALNAQQLAAWLALLDARYPSRDKTGAITVQ